MSGVVFDNVSKFYGEVLGVNHVQLDIQPGITSLVGPNGSGKSTLMNLMTGLVRPTRGQVTVLGISPSEPERLFHRLGYCTQFDSYPAGVTGCGFLRAQLRLHGYGTAEADRRARAALERVNLEEAGERRLAGYSKGMRQRIRLAQALAHDPEVLVLDEPLNGLDPVVRAQTIALFRQLGTAGRTLILSSHVLHEVDAISDRAIMLSQGYVVAEGQIQEVRGEMREHPLQIRVRCSHPRELAAAVLGLRGCVAVELLADAPGLLARTRDPEGFYLALNRLAVAETVPGLEITSVAPADADAGSVYGYLVGGGAA